MNQFVIEEIIIIDDDEIVHMLGRKALKMIGFEGSILHFFNGMEALDFFKQKSFEVDSSPPFLVLLDLNMPIVDGWEVLEHLAENASCLLNQLSLTILSNSYNPMDREKALSYPFVLDFLNKPISPDLLTNFLNQNNLIQP